MEDEVMQLILKDVDPRPPSTMSEEEVVKVSQITQAEIRNPIEEFKIKVKGGDGDYPDFKFDANTEKSIVRALKKTDGFSTDPAKLRLASQHIKGLLEDYKWSVQNARLINRVRQAVGSFSHQSKN
jgi:hypothetical protein